MTNQYRALPKSDNGQWNYFIYYTQPGGHGSLIASTEFPIEHAGVLDKLTDHLRESKGTSVLVNNIVPLSMP
jgi:hypothetical protein